MKRILIIFLLLCSSVFAQVLGGKAVVGGKMTYGKGAAAAGIALGSQTCVGGGSATVTSQACNASMTLTTSDIVVCVGTVGSVGRFISTITHTGTAAITWTVNSSMLADDSVNQESFGGGWGNVTSGGTATPSLNWNNNGTDSSIACANFTGAQAATDGANAFLNTAPGTGANGVLSGTATTTVNGDGLIGGLADVSGNSATITAGTSSVTFTKIVCSGVLWGGLTCLQWGTQTTAAAGTQAAWKTSAGSDRTFANFVALKKQ